MCLKNSNESALLLSSSAHNNILFCSSNTKYIFLFYGLIIKFSEAIKSVYETLGIK